MRDANWKQIAEFPNYWVSDDGRVVNLKTKRIIKIIVNGNVHSALFYKDGKMHHRSIPKLQKEAFRREWVYSYESQEEKEQS